MVISMEVLGDHQIYSHFAFTGRPKNNFKKNPGWFESAKIPDIWENQNGGVHAHGNGRKQKRTQWYEILLARGEYISQVP